LGDATTATPPLVAALSGAGVLVEAVVFTAVATRAAPATTVFTYASQPADTQAPEVIEVLADTARRRAVRLLVVRPR
jgi:hypothetical protein